MYGNATDLCVLILYPVSSQNSSVRPSGFLVTSLGFSMFSIISSAHSDSFYFFLFNLDSFYFFLLWLLWINFQTMLNKNGVSGHPFLVPNLEEMLSAFYQSMMLAVSLSYMAFIMFRYIPSVCWRVFVINWCWILSKAFSAYIEMNIWLCQVLSRLI